MSKNGSQKHEREAVRMIERTFPGVKAHVELRASAQTHKWLVAQKDDVETRVPLSGSPGIDTGNLLNYIRQNVRREFAAKGVKL